MLSEWSENIKKKITKILEQKSIINWSKNFIRRFEAAAVNRQKKDQLIESGKTWNFSNWTTEGEKNDEKWMQLEGSHQACQNALHGWPRRSLERPEQFWKFHVQNLQSDKSTHLRARWTAEINSDIHTLYTLWSNCQKMENWQEAREATCHTREILKKINSWFLISTLGTRR